VGVIARILVGKIALHEEDVDGEGGGEAGVGVPQEVPPGGGEEGGHDAD